MKVLVVEDDLMERKALQKLFELCYGKTFEVMTAYDGTSALERLARYHFDLVFLDIVLPDMSGVDVLEKMQSMKLSSKVIMATACSDYRHLRDSMRNHAIDYIIKPYSIETFKEAIDGFIKQMMVQDELYGSKKVVQIIKQYIDEHYHTKVKLDELSSLVSKDKSYIERLFKETYGMGIFTYLNQVRMREAKVLLAKGMGVSETAFQVGFDDPAYFGKCFKMYEGVSPQKFRQS